MPTYGALASISVFLRWAGIAIMVIAGVLALMTLGQGNGRADDIFNGPAMTVFKLIGVISLFVLGALVLALGEVFQAIVAMAINTGTLVELARQANQSAIVGRSTSPEVVKQSLLDAIGSELKPSNDREHGSDDRAQFTLIKAPLDTSKWPPTWMEPFANGGGLIESTRKVVLKARELGYETTARKDCIVFSKGGGQSMCYSNADVLKFAYRNDIMQS